jgi:hypothetical protein
MVAIRCGCVAVHLECVAVRLSGLWSFSALFCSRNVEREDRRVWPTVATGACATSGAERYHCFNPSFGSVPTNLANDRNPYKPSDASAAEHNGDTGLPAVDPHSAFPSVSGSFACRGAREPSGSFRGGAGFVSQRCLGWFRSERPASINIFHTKTCDLVASASARKPRIGPAAIAAESRELNSGAVECAVKESAPPIHRIFRDTDLLSPANRSDPADLWRQWLGRARLSCRVGETHQVTDRAMRWVTPTLRVAKEPWPLPGRLGAGVGGQMLENH